MAREIKLAASQVAVGGSFDSTIAKPLAGYPYQIVY